MFAASLRKGSYNKKLIRLIEKIVKAQGCETDLADFAEFELPIYNADILEQKGLPATARNFIERLKQSDALIISSPEYNFSTPGALKNLIDWISRDQPMPWNKQMILLTSASPSLVGGNRGLWHTRVPLECCGAFVYPDMFSLAAAHNAFNDEDELQDKSLHERLETMVKSFLKLVKQVEVSSH